MKDGIKPLVTSLEKLEVANDEKANGLLTVILQFYFIVVLVIVSSVLGVTAILSKKLQHESLDLNDAADYAKVCKTQLEDLTQNQAHFDKLYEEACNIAHDLKIEASWPREMRRRPQQLTLFTSLADFFNKTVFLPFIESMLHQIETRLVHSEPHFRATWLLPSKLDFLLSDAELIDKLIQEFSHLVCRTMKIVVLKEAFTLLNRSCSIGLLTGKTHILLRELNKFWTPSTQPIWIFIQI